MPVKPLTLADFSVPVRLRCMHCSEELPKSAPTERFDKYVVVECRKCHLMTPFQLEKTA